MAKYYILIAQIILIIVLAVIALKLLLLSNAYQKEKRLSRFTVESLTNKQISFFDMVEAFVNRLIKKISCILKKSTFLTNHSKRFNKYIDTKNEIFLEAMDLISIKILSIVVVLILIFISNALKYKIVSFAQLFVAILIAYFIPNVIWALGLKRRKNIMKHDLEKAVIIMGNAFKSGRNTMQAIKLVSEELDSEMGEEFKKMYVDLTFGLDLDKAFDRFYDRVKMEEVRYISASLVVLNKTGGNIVNVFSSIERSFFDRKKLLDELKSTKALSELVFKILIVMPLVITIVIYIFNSDYFKPFIETNIGLILLLLIIIIYALYILVARRIMKFKEW